MARSRTARPKPSPAPSAPVEPQQPESKPDDQPCPHGATADCPLCEMDSAASQPGEGEGGEPGEEPGDTPSNDEGGEDESDESDNEPADGEPAEPAAGTTIEVGDGVELPLDEGEEVVAQRIDDDAVLWIVTSFGRKLGIDPDGWIAVVSGPELDVVVPAVPKPPKPWKQTRD